MLLENRYLRTAFSVELKYGDCAEASEHFAYGSNDDLPNRLLVFKFDFGLGRVYIDINVCRVYFEIQEVRNLLTCRYQLVISFHYCLGKIRMSHETAVDKEILVATLFL